MKKHRFFIFFFCFLFYGNISAQTAPDSILREAKTVLSPKAPIVLISDIQKALAERGYYDGPIDNILSKEVRTALTDFKKREGLPVCSSVGDMSYLYRALGITP